MQNITINSVTLKDIAKLANVDTSTVSRAINDSPLVRTDLKKKIQDIAKKLNYTPHASAFSLKKKLNRSVALVFPYLEFMGGEFYSWVYSGIAREIEKHLFSITLADIYGENNSFYRILKERRIDGAILIGDTFTQKEIETFDNIGIPIAIINQHIQWQSKNLLNVYFDNTGGVEAMTDHLIKEQGRKKLIYISGGEKYQTNNERLEGFVRSVKKNNAKYNLLHSSFEKSHQGAYEAVSEMLKSRTYEFDAVFGASDDIAIGAIKALKEHDIKIPEDVAVAGYDNLKINDFISTPLSSVDPGAFECGEKTGQMIINWILSKEQPKKLKIKIPSRLVLRQSSGS